MQETFYFDSAPQPYRAEAAVVWRFDDRITLAVQKFLNRRNFLQRRFDPCSRRSQSVGFARQ